MTLVDTQTGELVEAMTEVEAKRISSRIALRLDTIADNYDAVVPLIREAIQRQAWMALGYRSPGEYAAEEFGGALSRLGAEFRQDVTRELASLGMSTRAIAPVVGVSNATVSRDLAAGVADVTPDWSGPQMPTLAEHLATMTPTPESEGEADEGVGHTSGGAGETTPEAVGDEARQPDGSPTSIEGRVAPRPPVTGLDGKVYNLPTKVPAPKPVMNDDEADYANAEKSSLALARAISKLLTLQHQNMRDGVRRYWSMASNEVPPTARRDVTPEQMRVAAQGLLTLADEWEHR